MTLSSKRLSLLLLAGALFSFILLSASLTNLQLDSGNPFPDGIDSSEADLIIKTPAPMRIYTFPMLEGVLALILTSLALYLAARIILAVDIKIILRLVAAIMITLVLLYLIHYITQNQTAVIPDGIGEFITPPVDQYAVAPLGQPPRRLIWLVIIGIVTAIGIPVGIYLLPSSDTTIIHDKLMQEAEAAVYAIETGENIRNVVLRCYLQMAYLLQEERRIERDHAMTVREFEGLLASLGFPYSPVRQLTYLFEKVRYGGEKMNEIEEMDASQSLNQIIDYCRSQRA